MNKSALKLMALAMLASGNDLGYFDTVRMDKTPYEASNTDAQRAMFNTPRKLSKKAKAKLKRKP